MFLRNIVHHLKVKYADYLERRYDIGLRFDPPHSLADLATRHLFAREHQNPALNLPRRLGRQFRAASNLFHLRRAIRKLKLGTIPIRIAFIAQDPLDWLSLDPIYRACVSDPAFKTFVVSVGCLYEGVLTECTELFQKTGVEYLDAIRGQVRLDLLHPDIVAISSPYDQFRPDEFRVDQLLRYGKLVYVCYGPDFIDKKGDLAKQTFGYDSQANAWRIFSRSDKTANQYRRYGGSAEAASRRPGASAARSVFRRFPLRFHT